MNKINSDIKYLKGVGERRAILLNKLGIKTILDMLEFFPKDYLSRTSSNNLSEVEVGTTISIIGTIAHVEEKRLRKMRQLNVLVKDERGNILCTWFRYGKWITDQMKDNNKIWISGYVKTFKGFKQIVHPEFEVLDEEGNLSDFWKKRNILPRYNLTNNLHMSTIRNMIYNAFSLYHSNIEEKLPEYLIKKYEFDNRHDGLQKMHFPNKNTDIKSILRRFKYEEFFYHQLMLARVKGTRKESALGVSIKSKGEFSKYLISSLPFELTNAQKKVIEEILIDMRSPHQMNRLLQGDVGSGKTIVTLCAMLTAIEEGYQAILMAPTEILAEQHYKTATNLLSNIPNIDIALLKGGNYKGKKELKARIKNGSVNIVFGTHALIQKDVEFFNLGFAAIDEQHRFGVLQRANFHANRKRPNILHMSATPIPRSLALSVYGDMEVSVIDELPPTRKPIETIWKSASSRNKAYKQVENELVKGKQIYIVCPLIAESEKMDLLDAETLFKQIENEIFPNYKTELLHGKMKTSEKDEIMNRFKDNKINILVSTTVIEVGIDVPNATVMIIEHSERFGLSQLHQLRGRVGRGAEKSFCYLISYPPISLDGRERLSTMVTTNDGFEIAEKDLEIRGPGDFFGTSQSGMPDFKYASIVKDQDVLNIAREDAFKLIQNDPNFKLEENRIVKQTYDNMYAEKEKLFKY